MLKKFAVLNFSTFPSASRATTRKAPAKISYFFMPERENFTHKPDEPL